MDSIVSLTGFITTHFPQLLRGQDRRIMPMLLLKYIVTIVFQSLAIIKRSVGCFASNNLENLGYWDIYYAYLA